LIVAGQGREQGVGTGNRKNSFHLPLGEGEILAAHQADDSVEGGGPVLLRCGRIVAEGLDIETQRKAFLRAGKIDQRWPKHAVEHGEGLVQRSSVPSKAMQKLLVLVERSEDRALAPQDVDIADEAEGGIAGRVLKDIEVEPKMFEFVRICCRSQRPRIALGRKYGRAGRVQSAKSMHQRRIEFGFGKVVEVVGIFAQVDETPVAGGVPGIRPGNDKDGIVCSSLPIMRAAHRVYDRFGFRRAPERDWSPAAGVTLLAFQRSLGDPTPR